MTTKSPEAIAAQELMANVNTTDLQVPSTMHIGSETKTDDAGKKEIHDPNKEIMDKIYAKRRLQLESESSLESGIIDAEPAIDEIPVEQAPLKKADHAVAASSPSDDPIVTAGTQQPQSVKIKVEGKDLDVPFDTLVTLAQKGLSAEQRWQEAATLRQEAQRLMTPVEQAPARQNTLPPEIMAKDKLESIVKRINYGSEEEQAQALRDYGAAIESKVRDEIKPLPTEQIVNAATQNAVSQIRFQQDQATIASEFPEIFKDEGLSLLAGQISGKKVQQAQQTGQFRPLIDIWREALTETKTRYYRDAEAPATVPNPSNPPVQAASLGNKIERKRAAPQSPSSANKVASETPSSSGVSLSSIVNQMRKQRGQTVYTN